MDKLGNKEFSSLFFLIVLIIAGCGGGGSSSDTGNGFSPSYQAVGGGGVKGPLANADVSVYTIDTSQIDFKGEIVATATTNAGSAITGLELPFPLHPPYVIEFTSNQATTDLTTGQFPVIPTLRSVITQETLAAGKQVYATPLTSMVVDLAIAKADSTDAPFAGNGDGDVSNAEFLAALPVAASQVASTVGFGMDSSVEILDTPPIIDDTTDTFAEQEAVAAYRAAVEALSAVVFAIHEQGLGHSPEAVLSELTADLADGEIDGEVNGSSSAIITQQALVVLASDPSQLSIPNSDDGYGNPIMVGEVNLLLSDETSETGSQVDTTLLRDGTIEVSLQPATTHPDADGDETPNAEDAFPTNPTESVDTDGDGIPNAEDNFPTNPSESTDTDGDGIGGGANNDEDNRGGGVFGSIDVEVKSSQDDAEEQSDGTVNLSSSDLELVRDGSDQTIGIRFQNIAIPRGATVTSAYVQFTADETNNGATVLTIQGETAGNAVVFSSSRGDISIRPTTVASVAWAPEDWDNVGSAGAAQRTPDLSAIIQEIVSHGDWVQGNALALIITGSGERTAESYNGNANAAPRLIVDFQGGSDVTDPDPQDSIESEDTDEDGNLDDSNSDNQSPGPGGGENNQPNGSSDDDGDGIDNIDEINADTDPDDADSFPRNILQKDFTVAFIGDQGLNENARAVLEMIKTLGADMVLHQGDFDYYDDPDAWDAMINDTLGRDFPYFASVGNHDLKAWSGYQRKLQARLSRINDADCSGDLGVKSACTYKGLFFILSGVGTRGSGHEAYIRDQLAQTNAIWRICTWHKNQRLMQVGSKPDEVGWGAYEACREGGAIVATGHEHSYSRTHLLDNFRTQSIASTSNTLQIEEGKSFAFVSGLGGRSIRPQKIDGPWWASVWSTTQRASYGALFCTFNPDGVARRANCYFNDIAGAVPDQFEVISRVETGTD